LRTGVLRHHDYHAHLSVAHEFAVNVGLAYAVDVVDAGDVRPGVGRTLGPYIKPSTPPLAMAAATARSDRASAVFLIAYV